MRITHASVWKRKPREKNSFNSDEVRLAFPVLNARKITRVLDVACGNGLGVSLPLLREGYNVYAFDKWKAAIAAARKNARAEHFTINAKTGDMYKRFTYTPAFFDASFCFQAIYHGTLPQIQSTLKEIKRVTKRGGYFFGTFLPYYIKEDKGRWYFNYTRKNGTIGRIYVRPDPHDKHLCYNLAKNCEYMVPHYHFRKPDLQRLLSTHFREVSIRRITRPDKCITVWFVQCKV
jgi:SAM-dependent methyltransferase